MAVVMPLVVLLFSQATQATVADTAAKPPAANPPAVADQCPAPDVDSKTIVICTERPQGYRLDPDVMEARRETHSGGRPTRPGGKPIPDCTAGPQPCTMPGINLLGVALTAAEMAKRAAQGQEVGSMFVTDPHPSEYQLYMMAKARREAEEADKADAAKAKAAASNSKVDPPDQAEPDGN